jgi:peptide-methionine (R)-S-oxide reductase
MRFPWQTRSRTAPTVRAELRKRLTPEQYRVTQKSGTERPFSGAYHDEKADGLYRCVVCDAELFESDSKYDSGTGWPSFTAAVNDESVSRHTDRKLGLRRTEARCAACDAHLGHIFPDGPGTGGERFCMNSASLQLDRTAGRQQA